VHKICYTSGSHGWYSTPIF